MPVMQPFSHANGIKMDRTPVFAGIELVLARLYSRAHQTLRGFCLR